MCVPNLETINSLIIKLFNLVRLHFPNDRRCRRIHGAIDEAEFCGGVKWRWGYFHCIGTNTDPEGNSQPDEPTNDGSLWKTIKNHDYTET